MDFRPPAKRALNTMPCRLEMISVTDDDGDLGNLLRDPLTRLVMKSDGVTEETMIALMTELRRTLAARQNRMRSKQSTEPRVEPIPELEML